MFGGSHAHVLVEEGMGLSANHRALHQVSLQCRVLVLGHLQEKGGRLGDEEASSCCLNHQQQFALEAPWCFFCIAGTGPLHLEPHLVSSCHQSLSHCCTTDNCGFFLVALRKTLF